MCTASVTSLALARGKNCSPTTRVAQDTRKRRTLGMSTAPRVLASRGVGHDEGIRIDQGVIPQDRERKGTSQCHGRISAEALSKEGRPGRSETCNPSCNVAADVHGSPVEAGKAKLKPAILTATQQWSLKQLLGPSGCRSEANPHLRVKSRPRSEYAAYRTATRISCV